MKAWKMVAAAGGLLIVALLLLGSFALGMEVGRWRTARALPISASAGAVPAPLRWLAQHGVTGTVESVDQDAQTIVVVNGQGARHLVLVTTDTILVRGAQKIELATVGSGERIVAIGAPDEEGRIIARVIRLRVGSASGSESMAPPAFKLVHYLYRLGRQANPWFVWRTPL